MSDRPQAAVLEPPKRPDRLITIPPLDVDEAQRHSDAWHARYRSQREKDAKRLLPYRELTSEQISSFSTEEYSRFLTLLSVSTSPQASIIALRHLPIIANRFSSDIRSTTATPENNTGLRLTDDIASATQRILGNIGDKAPGLVEQEIIDQLYSYITSDNSILRHRAIGILPELFSLGETAFGENPDLAEKFRDYLFDDLLHPQHTDPAIDDALLSVVIHGNYLPEEYFDKETIIALYKRADEDKWSRITHFLAATTGKVRLLRILRAEAKNEPALETRLAFIENLQKATSASTTDNAQNIPEEKDLHASFPFTAADIRATQDDTAILHEVVKALDAGTPIPTDIVCALFSKNAVSVITSNTSWDEQEEARKQAQLIPYPPSAYGTPMHTLAVDNNLLTMSSYNKGEIETPLRRGVSRHLPYGINADEGEDPLETVSLLAYNSLSTEQKKAALAWMLYVSEKHTVFPEMNTNDVYFLNTFGMYQNSEILNTFLDYIDSHKQQYVFTQQQALNHGTPPVLDTVVNSLLWNFPEDKIIAEAILSRPEEEQKAFLAIKIDQSGYANTLNAIRNALDKKMYSPSTEAKLLRVGKILLGIDPNDQEHVFHTNLNAVYEALGEYFKDYTPNLHANEQELAMLEGAVSNVVDQRAAHNPEHAGITVVDLGCGTGRIANGLAKKHLTGIREIIGLDNSPDVLSIAQAELSQVKDAQMTPVTYKQSDWNAFKLVKTAEDPAGEWESNLDFPPSSVDMLICIGRTLTHAEDTDRFKSLVEKAAAAIKPGGVMIFDFPDPNKGAYLENRKQLLHRLQAIGVPIKDDQLDTIDYVVDSADGKNLYNRYTPQMETIKKTFGYERFSVEELARAEIAGDLWTGSENVYFIARKLPLTSQKAA